MNLDKYKQAWKAESSKIRVRFDADRLSKEVWQSHERFRSTIFWRDVREVGTSLVMVPIWIVLGVVTPVPWTWYLTVPALLWVAGFMLWDRKCHPQEPSGPGEPLIFYVTEALAQVEHQIWLLRNVFWWYLLPFSMSIMAFFLHMSWKSSDTWWGFAILSAFFGLFLLVIYGWIYRLNQRAIRDTLDPRRRDLVKLVESVEDNSDPSDSGDIMELVTSLSASDQSAGLSANWATWSENWNRIIPSWRHVAIILVPTLAGAYCGFQYPLDDMGPVFFQSVVAAVIPFEIAFFSLWYLSHRRHRGQPLTGTGPSRPNAPAIVTIVMIVVISMLAVAALIACVAA